MAKQLREDQCTKRKKVDAAQSIPAYCAASVPNGAHCSFGKITASHTLYEVMPGFSYGMFLPQSAVLSWRRKKMMLTLLKSQDIYPDFIYVNIRIKSSSWVLFRQFFFFNDSTEFPLKYNLGKP